MNHSLKVRFYKDSDWDDISELLISKLFRTEERLLTFWKWQVEENPFVSNPKEHRIVVEDTDTNRAVAFIAYYQNRMVAESKEYSAATIMHYATDDRYKGAGIALFRKFLRDNKLCLTNLTNDKREINQIKTK